MSQQSAVCRAAAPSPPPRGSRLGARGDEREMLKIHQRGVQWKQGVVIYMM